MWGIWLLVVNGLIGAGIFGLPSGAYQLAGSYSVFVYIFCALLILPVILCFAEVGSYFRGTGGPMRYGQAAFGSFYGFQGGWLYYIARMISFSANSVLLVDSIGYFIPGIAEGSWRLVTLAIICGGLTLLNVLGAVGSIRTLAGFTILKFFVLILLVFGGVVILKSEVVPEFSASLPTLGNFGSATLLLIYAYVGFEGAVVPAGESRNPSRDMPRALLLGLGMVALLYICIQLVSQAAVPNIGSSTTPLLDASAELFGAAGAVILMIGVVASVGGNLVSAIFTTPRVTYALSLEGNLPKWFGVVHSRFLTPANSIVFFGIFAFIGAAFGSFIWLAAMTVLARLFVYILTCVAIPVLRPRMATEDSFVLKGGYSIPVLGVLACIWLMFQVNLDSVLMTTAFILVGWVLYLIARRENVNQEV
jgi:amino acid transporter